MISRKTAQYRMLLSFVNCNPINVTCSHKMIDKSHFGTIEILYILKEEKMLIIMVKK